MSMRRPAGFISANYDPLKNPNAPTGVSASGGDASASVSFTAPSNVGGSAITAYYAVSNPGQITATGASSPITVTGLTNGTPYTFNVWALNSYGPGVWSAASGSVTPAFTRGLFGGGEAGTNYNIIDYITIATTGNAIDFGDLNEAYSYNVAGLGSATRAIFGKVALGNSNLTNYVEFSTLGNGVNFGNLVSSGANFGACSNSTRGIFAGGRSGSTYYTTSGYCTIATTGNFISFGTLVVNIYQGAGCSSPTRGVFIVGIANGSLNNSVEYCTIATTGSWADFGDVSTNNTQGSAAVSSATRGVFSLGGSTPTNVLEYVTIATTGNSIDFGDLTVTTANSAGVCSNVRGCFGGGTRAGVIANIIDYITIASTGNAIDFGDLTVARQWLGGASNGHGGLQ